MPSPNVKVNSFFKNKQKPFIDPVSKLYIATACILGLNRLPVILSDAKYIVTSLAFVYTVLISAFIHYMTYIINGYTIILITVTLVEYMFCITFSLITWKRMKRYYNELNKFDAEIGCRPKVTSNSVTNFIFMVVFNVCLTIFYYATVMLGLRDRISSDRRIAFVSTPINLLHSVELYYYGHLLSLVVPRMSLINCYVETALSDGISATWPNVESFKCYKTKSVKNSESQKLLNLYYTVIQAYDFLNDAIKWQLLVVLITMFIAILTFSYSVVIDGINGKASILSTVIELGFICSKILPLFSPCIFSDQVHDKVRRLRQLLTSRLFEKKLTKSGRSAARALLALTEARDLSFTLLRMIRVNISLPFKLIGLLVTYLIILIQFEKVLNSDL